MINEFQAQVIARLNAELAKWQSGEIKWNMNNQFNESILEDAVKHAEAGNVNWQEMFEFYNVEQYGGERINVMDYARHISHAFDDAEDNLADLINSQNI